MHSARLLACRMSPRLVSPWLAAAWLAGCGVAPATPQPEAPRASEDPTPVVLPLQAPAPKAPPVGVAEAPSTEPSEPPAPEAELLASSQALREPPSEMHRELDAIAAEIDAGRAAQARSRLTLLLRELQTTGSLDEEMTGRALLARAHDRLGARPAASAEYDRILAVWEKDKSLGAVKRGEGSRDHARMAHALSAVAEALFFQAERLRDHADQLRKPTPPRSTYRPSKKPVQEMNAEEFEREMEKRAEDTRRLKAHIDNDLKGWIEEKRRRIDAAERAYARIPQLQPAAPPVWVVAAAERVGTLWSNFADAFRTTPAPSWIAGDAELMGVYREGLDQAAAPIVQRARGAFEMCGRAAETYRVDTEAARACKKWLRDHTP